VPYSTSEASDGRGPELGERHEQRNPSHHSFLSISDRACDAIDRPAEPCGRKVP
jgi:hypothetical protein